MKKLTKDQLFNVANKLAEAYSPIIPKATIAKAVEYKEGQINPSRNYLYGILINTKTKSGSIAERYSKEDANSIIKLTIYKLANPRVDSLSIDI
jgi:hypothetical protein